MCLDHNDYVIYCPIYDPLGNKIRGRKRHYIGSVKTWADYHREPRKYVVLYWAQAAVQTHRKEPQWCHEGRNRWAAVLGAYRKEAGRGGELEGGQVRAPSTGCSRERPRLHSQHPYGDLQTSVTPVPGEYDLLASKGPVCMWCSDIQKIIK